MMQPSGAHAGLLVEAGCSWLQLMREDGTDADFLPTLVEFQEVSKWKRWRSKQGGKTTYSGVDNGIIMAPR